MNPLPKFKRGEPLSAGKLNQLAGGFDATRLQAAPGMHIEQGPEGVTIQDVRYRRITIGKTGGYSYPSSATDGILTEYPFEFVDIDPDLGIGTAVLKRGDEYTVRNLLGTHIPADTLIELIEHRGEWWTSYGGTGVGAGLTIRFRITASAYCGDCYVTARVISVPFGVPVGDLPDVDTYANNEVLIYDKAGCFFNEPPEDLLDRIGYATYLTALEDGPCPDTFGDFWECIALCCDDLQCGA